MLAAGIRCLENTRGLELLTSADGTKVVGAVLLDIQTGTYFAVRSKAVILATGAGPLMYQRAACAQEKAMDGVAMAYRAGAKLMDMEMVQFHPTGLVVPGSRLNGALLEEGLRGGGSASVQRPRGAIHGAIRSRTQRALDTGPRFARRVTWKSWRVGGRKTAAC